MNKIKYTFYSFIALLFVSFSVSAQCTYTVDMTDSFGDGWQGGVLSVSINGATPIDFNIEDTGGVQGTGGDVGQGTFDAAPGDVLTFTYTDGLCGFGAGCPPGLGFDFENDFTVTDCNGNAIIMGNGNDFDSDLGETTQIFISTALGQLTDACENTLVKEDSFGDGWNGNTLTISVDGVPYAQLSALDNGSVASSDDCLYNFTDGTVLDFLYNGEGSFLDEVSYSWFDSGGNEVFAQIEPTAQTADNTTVSCGAVGGCVFTCPTDVPSSVTLGPGECEAAISFTIEVSGDCDVFTPISEDFTGAFAPEAVTNLGGPNCVGFAPTSLIMQSSDLVTGACTGIWNFVTYDVPEDGTITFNYTHLGGGAVGLDHFGYALNLIDGIFILPGNLVDVFSAPGVTGLISIDVSAGDQFAFAAWVTNGGPWVADGTQAVVLFTNFAFGTEETLDEGPLTITEYVPVGEDQELEFCVTSSNDEDGNGVLDDETCCSYEIDIVSYPFPVTSLACNDLVNVSVNEDCLVEVNADMFLEGGPYACYTEDYSVYVSGIPGNVNGQAISLATGNYQVTVEDNATGNTCWGNMLVEDKLAPTMDCNCPEGGVLAAGTNFNNFTQTLELADDVSFDITGNPCLDFGGGGAVGPFHVYDEFELGFTVAGTYTIQQNTTWGDGQMMVYSEPFNPNDACANLITGSDDFNGFDPEITQFFEAGTAYYFVFTSWQFSLGDYDVDVVAGPGDMINVFTIYDEECVVNCIADLTINPPVIEDNCGNYNLLPPVESVSDEGGCREVLTRTWSLTDQNGTIVSTCVQEFSIRPLTFSDITLPPALVELPCGSGTDPADIKAYFDNPNGIITNDIPLGPTCALDVVENCEGTPYAYPHYFVTGCDGGQHPQAVDNSVCNIFATYEDQDIPACGVGCYGNSKEIRTWTLLDWCTGGLTNFVQVIKAVDQEAPTFTVNDATVSTDPWGCAASTTLPIPWELHDNCDEYPTYTVAGPAGILIVGEPYQYGALNLPKGVHTFTYNATDCCDNVGTHTITITVVDQAAPVPVAKQNIIIGLTSSGTSDNGTAKLFASSVDNGSHDGCTDVHIEIRRDSDLLCVDSDGTAIFPGNTTYNADGHPEDGLAGVDTDGGQFVKFCCEDLTDVDDNFVAYGTVKVWMRVWDDGDMNGVYGTSGDNYNEIWVDVRVEDKLTPALVCPPDVTIQCDEDDRDLSLTGTAVGYATCDGLAVDYTDTRLLSPCNEGTITRKWFFKGQPLGQFCLQTITLEREDDYFDGPISWPTDMTVNCIEAIPGEPTWVAGPCDVIGYDVDSDTFLFEDGACFKIINEYTVIDWCQYEPNSPFWRGEGIWTWTQIIKVIDNVAPVIACVDTMYAVNDNNDLDGDGNLCENRAVELVNSAVDGGGDCNSKWLKWQIEIDVWGDNTVDYVFSSFVSPLSPFYVEPTGSNADVKVTIPEDIESSMSNHKVYWQVTDGCGNNSGCGNTFMVVDKKAPTPYCVSLSSALMDESGEVELWACDFNIGSFDNCTDQDDLRYTFTSTPPEQDLLFDADRGCSSRVFKCEDLPVVEVQMYVWDQKGNSDFCVVTLSLVDNFLACEGGAPRADIAGLIKTETGVGVEEVTIALGSILPETEEKLSNDYGYFAFNNNYMDYDYSIVPSKNGDYMNGVSTLDLVLIQRHILNLQKFTSPYNVIAADINFDAKVSAADLVELRKLILGVNTSLESNTSWRFVDATQEFADVTQPWPFVQIINISPLEHDMMDNDFVGVKIGDVNGSVEANFNANSTEVRTANAITLTIAEQTVEVGQEVSVEMNSADFADVYGYQFTMELNGLNFASVNAGAVAMNAGNIGVLKSNLITVSYSNITAVTAGSQEGIFTMNFMAVKAGQLSDMIKITSRATQAEAYVGSSLEINDIELSIITEEGQEVSNGYALNQNEPNPFKDVTTVSFYSPEDASATITVYDVTGKVVTVRDMEAVKGHNETTFNKSDLGASGVLYYQLESGDFTATKKMIIIE